MRPKILWMASRTAAADAAGSSYAQLHQPFWTMKPYGAPRNRKTCTNEMTPGNAGIAGMSNALSGKKGGSKLQRIAIPLQNTT